MGKKTEQLELRQYQHAPLSLQLARYLSSEVMYGRLMPSQKLSSVRQLAEQFGCGRQVVLSALTLLVKQGILCSAARQGYYVNPAVSCGRYYRLGYFLNRVNPVSSGKHLETLYFAARKRGWELVFGSNYEEEFELPEWLERKNDLDGVFVNGVMDEGLLRTLSMGCLPYVIIGNHDIGAEYIQVRSRIAGLVADRLLQTIRKHQLGQLVSVVGPEFVHNEKLIAGAIRQRLRQAGLLSRDFPILHARNDGYAELDHLLRSSSPQALFFLGEHCLGWQKYRQQHPGPERPLVFLTQRWSAMLARQEYDGVINPGKGDYLEERSMQKMLNLIDNKIVQPHYTVQEKQV
ncbi:MAG: winged helix-turn-helix transcriptional regulator [Oligosphaeraceae bacterium]|nr:winged helix-turn-helix transcriptional regulator [Oligosphaeraceae bacterium]